MFPDPVSPLDLLFVTLQWVFMAWPLWLIASLRGRGRYLQKLLIVWGVCAAIRTFIVFDPNPLVASFPIPEPLDTILFVIAGAALLALYRGVSLWKRQPNRQPLQQARSVADLLSVSPAQFENMIAEYLRANGHQVQHIGAQGDHGIDLIVRATNGEKWIVQCKRWRRRVGEPAVRDLYGALMHVKADRAMLFTTGTFTPAARQWASGKPIFFYDGETFLSEIGKVPRQGRATTKTLALTPWGKAVMTTGQAKS